jgi:hypothetical protein
MNNPPIASSGRLFRGENMKRVAHIVGAVILVVAIGLSTRAQDQSKLALAEELLNLLNVRETQEKALTMYQQMMVALIQENEPKSGDPAVRTKVASLMEKTLDMVKAEMSWDKRKEDYIVLYSETYTEPELKDMIAFYKTPSGQALVKKQPEVLKRSFELSQKVLSELMPKIKAMTNELKEDTQSKPTPEPGAK